MFHLPLRGNQISMEPRVRLLRARMMERGQGVRPRRSSQTAEALSAPTYRRRTLQPTYSHYCILQSRS
jgi:hypothetical protein